MKKETRSLYNISSTIDVENGTYHLPYSKIKVKFLQEARFCTGITIKLLENRFHIDQTLLLFDYTR